MQTPSFEEADIVSVFRALSKAQVDAMNWYAFDNKGRGPIAPVCRFLVFIGLLDVFQTQEIDGSLLIERFFYRMKPTIRSTWRSFFQDPTAASTQANPR